MFTSYKDKMVSYYTLSSTVSTWLWDSRPGGVVHLCYLYVGGSACANRKSRRLDRQFYLATHGQEEGKDGNPEIERSSPPHSPANPTVEAHIADGPLPPGCK